MPDEEPRGDPVAAHAMQPVTATVLEGTDVALVAVDPGHAGDLFGGSHGSEPARQIWTYMPYGPFADVLEMERWLSSLTNSVDPLFFTVIDARQDRPVGMASFLNVELPMRRLEVGHIWYSLAAQRTTANTEAVYLMAGHAFDELGARRLEWKCDSLNQRSRTAAIRLGFRFEGVLRNHMIVKERNRDTAYFAMTDAEWPQARSNLGRWLYETDRDSSGRPIESLTELMEAVSRED